MAASKLANETLALGAELLFCDPATEAAAAEDDEGMAGEAVVFETGAGEKDPPPKGSAEDEEAVVGIVELVAPGLEEKSARIPLEEFLGN